MQHLYKHTFIPVCTFDYARSNGVFVIELRFTILRAYRLYFSFTDYQHRNLFHLPKNKQSVPTKIILNVAEHTGQALKENKKALANDGLHGSSAFFRII